MATSVRMSFAIGRCSSKHVQQRLGNVGAAQTPNEHGIKGPRDGPLAGLHGTKGLITPFILAHVVCSSIPA